MSDFNFKQNDKVSFEISSKLKGQGRIVGVRLYIFLL